MLKLVGEIIKIEKGGTGHPALAAQGLTGNVFGLYRVITINMPHAGLMTLRLAWNKSEKLKIGDAMEICIPALAAKSSPPEIKDVKASSWVTTFDFPLAKKSKGANRIASKR